MKISGVMPTTPMQERGSFDVVIIGGGIIGCALARELTRYRIQVALVEKEVEVGFGASKANSGIIHGGHHAHPATLKGKLEWTGNQRWDQLCAELGFGFKRIGELTVALSPEEVPALHKLLAQGEAKGVPGLALWDSDRIRRTEPALSKAILAAVYAPTTAVINPYEACFGLAESACHNGLTLLTACRVQSFTQAEHGWTVHTTRGDLQTHFVINAAGLYADVIAELAGVRTFTIQPRKGEEYLLDKRLKGLVKHVIFPCPTPVSKGILVIPTFDGTLMVGPTAETIRDKEKRTTTMAGGSAIFAAVQRLAPGISEQDCIAEFAGVRAAAQLEVGERTDGEDFIIGPTAKRGFLHVAGIQSPGLTAAPAIAELVVELLRDEGLALVPKAEFVPTLPRPIHFATLSTEEQIALAAHDGRYGRIVCRCETVTEGEVVEAIRRGACTLDGIKFRTRAGMGRCQGGFCTARCMEILARELAISLTAVTKRGGASWLVLDRSERVEIERM
ncbi:MAG: NAD(P)/FAD-dependent oxidoreductase [Caldilineaceae bacterium]